MKFAVDKKGHAGLDAEVACGRRRALGDADELFWRRPFVDQRVGDEEGSAVLAEQDPEKRKAIVATDGTMSGPTSSMT